MLLVLALPVGLAGATTPLLLDVAARAAGVVGPVAARLGAWGTLGSLVGALASGVVLVPLVGVCDGRGRVAVA